MPAASQHEEVFHERRGAVDVAGDRAGVREPREQDGLDPGVRQASARSASPISRAP